MRVLVCGDRNWTDREAVWRELSDLRNEYWDDALVVIEGGCTGADTFAREWCWAHRTVGRMEFTAEWNKYGRAAGPIRNQRMIDEGTPDLVLAFHADIGNSKGTWDLVKRANKAGIPVQIIPR